jgi:hypothetical protein
MDTFLFSSGSYKVNALIDSRSLDDYSIIRSDSKIQPYFEKPISSDPDVTGLMVYLLNSIGENLGGRVIYTTQEIPDKPVYNQGEDTNEHTGSKGQPDEEDNETTDAEAIKINFYRRYAETIIPVNKMGDDLPFFMLPNDLPAGEYIMVFQVLSGENNLYKTEKSIYYLGGAEFSFKGIHVHLPGIVMDSQLIPAGTIIMLEAKLDYDRTLRPYIVWYNGRKKISEGSYSEGAHRLLWKTPEQNNILALRVEVFPAMSRQGLIGFSQGISLPVSAKTPDMHLMSKDTAGLENWYIFEGDLKDSKMPSVSERMLVSVHKTSPEWIPFGGTYGLAAGAGNSFLISGLSLYNRISGNFNNRESRQLLLRFKPVDDGNILSVQFGPLYNVVMSLSIKDEYITLTLTSPVKTVYKSIPIPESDEYITAGINFSVWQDMLAAQVDLLGVINEENEQDSKPIMLAALLDGIYNITLGEHHENNIVISENYTGAEITAIWDEFALIKIPVMEFEIEKEPEE